MNNEEAPVDAEPVRSLRRSTRASSRGPESPARVTRSSARVMTPSKTDAPITPAKKARTLLVKETAVVTRKSTRTIKGRALRDSDGSSDEKTGNSPKTPVKRSSSETQLAQEVPSPSTRKNLRSESVSPTLMSPVTRPRRKSSINQLTKIKSPSASVPALNEISEEDEVPESPRGGARRSSTPGKAATPTKSSSLKNISKVAVSPAKDAQVTPPKLKASSESDRVSSPRVKSSGLSSTSVKPKELSKVPVSRSTRSKQESEPKKKSEDSPRKIDGKSVEPTENAGKGEESPEIEDKLATEVKLEVVDEPTLSKPRESPKPISITTEKSLNPDVSPQKSDFLCEKVKTGESPVLPASEQKEPSSAEAVVDETAISSQPCSVDETEMKVELEPVAQDEVAASGKIVETEVQEDKLADSEPSVEEESKLAEDGASSFMRKATEESVEEGGKAPKEEEQLDKVEPLKHPEHQSEGDLKSATKEMAPESNEQSLDVDSTGSEKIPSDLPESVDTTETPGEIQSESELVKEASAQVKAEPPEMKSSEEPEKLETPGSVQDQEPTVDSEASASLAVENPSSESAEADENLTGDATSLRLFVSAESLSPPVSPEKDESPTPDPKSPVQNDVLKAVDLEPRRVDDRDKTASPGLPVFEHSEPDESPSPRDNSPEVPPSWSSSGEAKVNGWDSSHSPGPSPHVRTISDSEIMKRLGLPDTDGPSSFGTRKSSEPGGSASPSKMKSPGDAEEEEKKTSAQSTEEEAGKDVLKDSEATNADSAVEKENRTRKRTGFLGTRRVIKKPKFTEAPLTEIHYVPSPVYRVVLYNVPGQADKEDVRKALQKFRLNDISRIYKQDALWVVDFLSEESLLEAGRYYDKITIFGEKTFLLLVGNSSIPNDVNEIPPVSREEDTDSYRVKSHEVVVSGVPVGVSKKRILTDLKAQNFTTICKVLASKPAPNSGKKTMKLYLEFTSDKVKKAVEEGRLFEIAGVEVKMKLLKQINSEQ